ASLELDDAIDLLDRRLRGRRRRRAVWRRLDVALHELAGRLDGGEPPDPSDVAQTLDRLVRLEPAGRFVSAAPVMALAMSAADPDLMDRVGVWLGGPRGRR